MKVLGLIVLVASIILWLVGLSWGIYFAIQGDKDQVIRGGLWMFVGWFCACAMCLNLFGRR